LLVLSPTHLWAQDATPGQEIPEAEQEQQVPDQVNVEPTAQDTQIEDRLLGILEATGWFVNPRVDVRDGVVFLDGQTDTQEHREWAGNLARNTQDVVAVVNRITLIPKPIWDFTPARQELISLWRGTIQAIPLFVFGIIVLLLAWFLALFIARFSRRYFLPRLGSPLLAMVASRVVAIPVFLLGIYLVLQVAGLTRLALTVLGGTGVVGIVVGLAFRDIAENFLASILLSIRQPFQRDDLIEVANQTGIVQQMNTRTTVLVTFDGNHVQIPNAIIYKSTIRNFTANPNRRVDFIVGIGYDDDILQAQELTLQILTDHPAVLHSPEPLVLVDELVSATVNLRIYLWYNAQEYAPIKVKSSILRLIKRAFQDAGISMPDEAREVIFPKGVPIRQVDGPQPAQQQQAPVEAVPRRRTPEPEAAEPVTSAAEGALRSEKQEVREQAAQSRTPEKGADLLETDDESLEKAGESEK
jgi:small-conductance mechanosensitive channel